MFWGLREDDKRQVEIRAELGEAVFLVRDNRFRATVELDGRRVWAYLFKRQAGST